MPLTGAISKGFSTTVQPVAMAGATLQTIWLELVPGRDQRGDADRLLHHHGAPRFSLNS